MGAGDNEKNFRIRVGIRVLKNNKSSRRTWRGHDCLRGRERGEREGGERGVERERRVRVHESEREGMGFKEKRSYLRGRQRRVGEAELGGLYNNH